jgi:hypothetical protein
MDGVAEIEAFATMPPHLHERVSPDRNGQCLASRVRRVRLSLAREHSRHVYLEWNPDDPALARWRTDGNGAAEAGCLELFVCDFRLCGTAVRRAVVILDSL